MGVAVVVMPVIDFKICDCFIKYLLFGIVVCV